MAKKPFLLRIDDRLAAELRTWAEESLRSMNGQIEYLLREAVTRRRRPLPPADDDEASAKRPAPR